MTSLNNLPDHLILEQIFTRLPVKDLIVLTSVRKSWLASISSRSFAETHLSSFHLNPNNHFLLCYDPRDRDIVISPINFSGNPHISLIPIPSSDDNLNLIDANDFIIRSHLCTEFLNSMQSVVGSINGLVCSSRPIIRPSRVFIWNPATHRFKLIWLPQFDNKVLFRIHVAFAFDSFVNDYKIVCIYEFANGRGRHKSYQFLMYSCNHDSWKDLTLDFPLQLGYVKCVIVKGNPYWMCFCEKQKNFWVKVDVQTEGIQMFDEPKYVRNETTHTSSMALEDFVAQAVFSPGAEANYMMHIYTFEENSRLWMRMHTFELLGVERPVSCNCYKNGKIILATGDHLNKKLFMYNLTTSEVKDLMVAQGREIHCIPMNYTESLVAVKGMVSVREEAAEEETAALTTNNRNASDATMLDDIS